MRRYKIPMPPPYPPETRSPGEQVPVILVGIGLAALFLLALVMCFVV